LQDKPLLFAIIIQAKMPPFFLWAMGWGANLFFSFCLPFCNLLFLYFYLRESFSENWGSLLRLPQDKEEGDGCLAATRQVARSFNM
jgi:hypothetical protein